MVLDRGIRMNIETINKWLDEEYGCSYTRLEELHDFYFEKYCDLKKENKILKENAYMKLCIIQLIEALQDNKETKVIKDYLVDVVDGVYGNTLGDNKEDYFSKLTKECD